MRWIVALAAAVVALSFTSYTHAAGHHRLAAATARSHTGTVVSVKGSTLTVKSTDKKGAVKEHKVKTDSSTKITLDGKTVKLSDLKEGEEVTYTVEKRVATEISATSGSRSSGRTGAGR